MGMASTVHLELYWQGSCSYGVGGEITGVDFKIGNGADQIFAQISKSAPSQLEQRLNFNVHSPGWLTLQTDSLDCKTDLIHLMQVTARVLESDATEKLLPVHLDEVPHFIRDETYQMKLRIQGSVVRATIDQKVHALALGFVGSSLMRMGNLFRAAAIPHPELDSVATAELQKRLESRCQAFQETKSKLHEVSLEGNQSFLAIVNNRRLELEVEIVSLRMALEKRRVHGF